MRFTCQVSWPWQVLPGEAKDRQPNEKKKKKDQKKHHATMARMPKLDEWRLRLNLMQPDDLDWYTLNPDRGE
jgi:hypothetical protein